MPDRDPPIVCTLDEEARLSREAEARELFSRALVASERTEQGLSLHFRADDDVEAAVRDLARREKACCAFFDFHVAREGGRVRLDWTGPVGAQALLDAVHAEAAPTGTRGEGQLWPAHGARLTPARRCARPGAGRCR